MQYKILYILICLVASSVFLQSCVKEDDYKKFVDNEERIYRARPSNLKVYPGLERAVISFELYNPVHVKSYEIYLDSTKVAEGAVAAGDTVKISREVSNLEEKTYSVSVFTVDESGNKSVTTTGFLNVFGDRYKSALNQRPVTRRTYKMPGMVIFDFSTADDNVEYSSFQYVNAYGQTRSVRVPSTATTYTLDDLPETGNILYRTFILPDATSIDTLSTGTDTIRIQNLEKQWFSSQEASGEGPNNGRAMFAFDNDLNTFWHTQYVGGTPGYPHWFIQDLGAPTTINSFRVARRNNSNTLSTSIRVEVRNINTDWQLVGNYNPVNVNGYQTFTAENVVTGRYIRYTGLAGPTTHTCVAEFDVNTP